MVAVSVGVMGVKVGGMGVHVAVCEGVRDGVTVNVAGAKKDSGLPRQPATNSISNMQIMI